MIEAMCGRYYRRSDKQRIAEAFHLGELPDGFALPPWDYNVAPTTFQPVIRNAKETDERELVLMRWGMVPHFAKSLADFKGISTINAKAETLMNAATWRVPFQRRRCLIPADGFYEWKKLDAKTKQPYAISMSDGAPFAFAGVWDGWKDPQGQWLQSFSIITTTANELTATVHNRMPVILEPKDYSRWLERVDGERPPVDLLRPFPAEDMAAREAHKDVGNVKNNHPELLNSA
jgi:putative SOS response-associated peptidase YedK